MARLREKLAARIDGEEGENGLATRIVKRRCGLSRANTGCVGRGARFALAIMSSRGDGYCGYVSGKVIEAGAAIFELPRCPHPERFIGMSLARVDLFSVRALRGSHALGEHLAMTIGRILRDRAGPRFRLESGE